MKEFNFNGYTVDPPSGWKYGFPKAVDEDIIGGENLNKWMMDNGYPQREIDIFEGDVPVRYWKTVDEN